MASIGRRKVTGRGGGVHAIPRHTISVYLAPECSEDSGHD